jgi:glycosyltransferase involved in cell wall biosynthesis
MPSKILFLIPYPLEQAPSQRFRFEQYFTLLQENGHDIEIQSFLTSQNWQLFFKPGQIFSKIAALLRGFTRRFLIVFRITKFDFVFIHREATPVGPPIIEWLLAVAFKARIIYDFDDAIWLTDRKNESWLLRTIKWRTKVRQICRWSLRVSCGNEYLCEYARRFSQNVFYNPTTVDTEKVHRPGRINKKLRDKLIIGWTGSHSTTKYLLEVEKILKQIQQRHPAVELLIIADRRPPLSIRYTFQVWDPDTEIADLEKIDIGIMPLPDDEWSKGKCGFKAIQYMALKIPCVLSPVGVNSRIVTNGLNGFLCATGEQWMDALGKLIGEPALRESMGEAGRKSIIENYSVSSNSRNFLSLFEKA